MGIEIQTLADVTVSGSSDQNFHQYPDDIDVTIKELHEAGKTQRQIAREIGKTQATVNRHIKKLGLKVTNTFGGRQPLSPFAQHHSKNGTSIDGLPELKTTFKRCELYEDLIASGDPLGKLLQEADDILEKAIHLAHEVKYKDDPVLEEGEWEVKIMRARYILGQD